PDTAVPDGERLERIAQVMQAAVEVSQLGRELTIFCLQAAGAGEVHRTGETGVSKEQADTDGDDREPGNQLDRGVGNLDDTRGLRIRRYENNGPSASCHRHSPGLGRDCGVPFTPPACHGVSGTRAQDGPAIPPLSRFGPHNYPY